MYNPFSLQGKTIMLTGGSSGIGRATAIECSKMGATLVLVARNEERLQQTMADLSGEGHTYMVADLCKEEDVIRLAESCPALDGLLSNVGINLMKPVAFYTEKLLNSVFGTNTFAPMLLNRWLLKKKKLKAGASVVFTSSIAAFLSGFGNGMYGASKAALTTYMRYFAQEMADKRIRANAVHPAMVETPLIRGGAVSEADLAADKAKYPMGRYGRPEEIAWAIIYFLSDASSWTTGASLTIDGGRFL